jgi:hypothetical protein
MKLLPEQLGAIRPIVEKLASQGPGEGSVSSDGAISLDNASKWFPGAAAVHVWQRTGFFGRRIVVDVVGKNGTNSAKFKPQDILK